MSLRCVPGERVIEIEYSPQFFEKFNYSIPANTYPQWEVALKILSYVLAMIMDVGGNALVIFIVVVSKRMRTPTNVLLVNLAVADLLVAALCMWVHLGANITSEWPFGLLICKVNMFAQATAITSSVLTLTVISVERFVAIVFPLRPGFTLRSTGAAIAAVWIVACAIAAPQLHVRYVQDIKWRNRHVMECLEHWPQYYDAGCKQIMPSARLYHTFVAVVMFFVPIIVIIDCYAVICVCLLVRKSPVSGAASDSHSRAKRKVVRMLVAVVVAFIVCWAPLHIMELRDIWRDDINVNVISKLNAGLNYKYNNRTLLGLMEQSPYMATVRYVVLYVAYLNSAVNPVLYAGFNENFRRGFKEVFTNGCLPFLKKRKVFPASLRSQSGAGSQMVQRATRANPVEHKPCQHTMLEQLQPCLNTNETTPANPGDESCHRPTTAKLHGSEGAGEDRQPVILDPSRLHVGNVTEGAP